MNNSLKIKWYKGLKHVYGKKPNTQNEHLKTYISSYTQSQSYKKVSQIDAVTFPASTTA